MPEYLTVSDFLAYDSQISGKIGKVSDTVEVVRAQVSSLLTGFKNYVSETDSYRLVNNKRLDGVDMRLDRIDGELADIKQAMNRGFALIFARLGIQP